jgi:retinol dehydrogenase 12
MVGTYPEANVLASKQLTIIYYTGYDLQFGTMVLGHFYLTKLLLPLLLSTASGFERHTSSVPFPASSSLAEETSMSRPSPPSLPTHARIINLATVGTLMTGKLRYPAFIGANKKARRKVGKQGLYIQSKLGLVLLSQELHRRYGDKGIVATSVSPGSARTGIYRWVKMTVSEKMVHVSILNKYLSRWAEAKVNQKIVMNPIELAALNPLYAATHPDGDKFGGKVSFAQAMRDKV